MISTLSYGVLIDVKSETVKANKYVDIFFVGKNSVISHSSSIVWEPERGNKADPYKERNVLFGNYFGHILFIAMWPEAQ